jgi:uncharacterized protein (TIGR03437 family)
MIRKARSFALTMVAAGLQLGPGHAQVLSPTILEIDVENIVQYHEDTSDFTKFATNPNVTSPALAKNFGYFVIVGDIVAVNGQPAKGTFTNTTRTLTLRPSPNPGEAIADTIRNTINSRNFEILNADATPIGTIMDSGLGVGSPPPGAPLEQTQGNNAIVGGTGAFVGVRGFAGQAATPQSVPQRQASMTEDPANRRKNGGGRARFVLTLIPMSVAQIATTSNGPTITHYSDFSLVTDSKPAGAGEILSLFATGLGPTNPGVDPGKPFPDSPSSVVNSPVEVLVNGKTAEVLAAVGLPGAVDGYQVNFRVPPDTAKGLATIQVSTAWIAGSPVQWAIQ